MLEEADDPAEVLHSYFATLESLDGTTDKLVHRDKYMYVLSAVNSKSHLGNRKLSVECIGRVFKFFPDDEESTVQALAQLCVDGDVAIKTAASEILVEVCIMDPSYVKRVADFLIQMYASVEPITQEESAVAACLVKLLHLEPRQALESLLDHMVRAEDVIRQPAIQFLQTHLSKLTQSANNTEIATLLVSEYRKILPECTSNEVESLVGSLSSLPYFQNVHGGLMLADVLIECLGIETPYTSLSPEQAHRLIACCRVILPCFSDKIPSTKLVKYFCDHVLPTITPEEAENQMIILQVFTELCASSGVLTSYTTDMAVVLDKLHEILPVTPVDQTTFQAVHEQNLQSIHFPGIECLLCAFHLLGKFHPQFLMESANLQSVQLLISKLPYLSCCTQLYGPQTKGQKFTTPKVKSIRKSGIMRPVIAVIKSLTWDLLATPPHFKDVVQWSWGKKYLTGVSPADKSPVGRVSTLGSVGVGYRIAATDSAGGKIRLERRMRPGQVQLFGRGTRGKITTSSPATETMESLESCTIERLRDLLTERNIPFVGRERKSDLISKLQDSLNATENDSEMAVDSDCNESTAARKTATPAAGSTRRTRQTATREARARTLTTETAPSAMDEFTETQRACEILEMESISVPESKLEEPTDLDPDTMEERLTALPMSHLQALLIERSIPFVARNRKPDLILKLIDYLRDHGEDPLLSQEDEPSPLPANAQDGETVREIKGRRTRDRLEKKALEEVINELFSGDQCAACAERPGRRGKVMAVKTRKQHIDQYHKDDLLEKIKEITTELEEEYAQRQLEKEQT